MLSTDWSLWERKEHLLLFSVVQKTIYKITFGPNEPIETYFVGGSIAILLPDFIKLQNPGEKLSAKQWLLPVQEILNPEDCQNTIAGTRDLPIFSVQPSVVYGYPSKYFNPRMPNNITLTFSFMDLHCVAQWDLQRFLHQKYGWNR